MNQSPWHHLYNTARWKKRRAAQLSQEPVCRYCHQLSIVTEATVADHVERHQGDEEKFFQGELQSLCKPCHDAHKQREEQTGLLQGNDIKGYPVDRRHPWNRE